MSGSMYEFPSPFPDFYVPSPVKGIFLPNQNFISDSV